MMQLCIPALLDHASAAYILDQPPCTRRSRQKIREFGAEFCAFLLRNRRNAPSLRLTNRSTSQQEVHGVAAVLD